MTRLAREVQGYIQSGIEQEAFGRLRKSIRFIVNQRRVIIYSSYYWIRFVNDGRRAVRARPGGPPLIFYKDPVDDPRIALDYPQKPNQRVRLTPEQFRRDKKAGKIIVTRSVSGALPKRFIEAGIIKFRKEAPKELRALIRGRTRDLLNRRSRSGKINVVL